VDGCQEDELDSPPRGPSEIQEGATNRFKQHGRRRRDRVIPNVPQALITYFDLSNYKIEEPADRRPCGQGQGNEGDRTTMEFKIEKNEILAWALPCARNRRFESTCRYRQRPADAMRARERIMEAPRFHLNVHGAGPACQPRSRKQGRGRTLPARQCTEIVKGTAERRGARCADPHGAELGPRSAWVRYEFKVVGICREPRLPKCQPFKRRELSSVEFGDAARDDRKDDLLGVDTRDPAQHLSGVLLESIGPRAASMCRPTVTSGQGGPTVDRSRWAEAAPTGSSCPRKGVIEIRRRIRGRAIRDDLPGSESTRATCGEGRRREVSVKLIDASVPALRQESSPRTTTDSRHRVEPRGLLEALRTGRDPVVGQEQGVSIADSRRESCARERQPRPWARQGEIDVTTKDGDARFGSTRSYFMRCLSEIDTTDVRSRLGRAGSGE